MDLGDWHPRDIPTALLNNSALQEQQVHTLPPLEQWYLTLLHNGKLPAAPSKRPNIALTCNLMANVKNVVPRLRWDLSAVMLRTFLLDVKRIGVTCTKHREAAANGWAFPPLADCRAAWERMYGPTQWDHPEVKEWGE
jgi:hypothetical protein